MAISGIHFKKPKRGSILVTVLGLIALMSIMLVSFMKEASDRIRYNGLLDRTSDLRQRAYSGLEIALANMAEMAEIDDGFRAESQGWKEPLAGIGFTPFPDCTIVAQCSDESARLPLASMSEDELTVLFEQLDISSSDAERLTINFFDWMDPNDNARMNGCDGDDYEREDIPCKPTNAVPRSWDEFFLIKDFSTFFMGENGEANERFRAFQDAVSLHNSGTVNINDASEFILDYLSELYDFDPDQLERLLQGDDRERGSLDDEILEDSEGIGAATDMSLVAYKAQLLRVRVVASRGEACFSLEVLLRYNGSSKSAANSSTLTSSSLKDEYKDFPDNPLTALSYPFTLLQIRENQLARN